MKLSTSEILRLNQLVYDAMWRICNDSETCAKHAGTLDELYILSTLAVNIILESDSIEKLT
jgi:hypothetical protein